MSTTLLIRSLAVSRAADAVSDALHVNACEGGKSALVIRTLSALRNELHSVLRMMFAPAWALDMSGSELATVRSMVEHARGMLDNAGYDSAHRPIASRSKRGAIIAEGFDLSDAIRDTIQGVLESRKACGMPMHATPTSDDPAKHTTWTADGAEACGAFDVCADGSIRERLEDIPSNPAACDTVRMLVRDASGFYLDCNAEHYARRHAGADVDPGDVWRAEVNGRSIGPWRTWSGIVYTLAHNVREV